MILLWIALAAAPGSPPAEPGLAAFESGRYEEAVRDIEASPRLRGSYEGRVALGVSYGRLGRVEDAARVLGEAVAQAPGRPEAFVERGGLHFLGRRYDAAAADLRRALDVREDPYTRDLLATALYLGGRTDEGVRVWNVLRLPVLRSVRIDGLEHTRDPVARRELGLAPDDVLDADALRLARRRLLETGVFRDVALRPALLPHREADLEVALEEKHGLGPLSELAARAAAHATVRKVQVRYENVSGLGVAVEGQYRWERARPALLGTVLWPRPLGAPVYLHVQGGRERQPFVLGDGGFIVRRAGLEAAFRHVLDARTTLQANLRIRRRTLDRPHPDAPPGRLAGVGISVERSLFEGPGQRVDLAVSSWRYDRAWGSERAYWRSTAAASFRRSLTAERDTGQAAAVLAVRVSAGMTGADTPADEAFFSGIAGGAKYPRGPFGFDFPLRAHRYFGEGGVVGESPNGRRILLTNLEWRLRCLEQSIFSIWIVPFYDAALVGGRGWHDLGVGLRLRASRTLTLRLDWAYGLTDDVWAVSPGVGELF